MISSPNERRCQNLFDTALAAVLRFLNGRRLRSGPDVRASALEAETGLAIRQLERAVSGLHRIRCDLKQVESVSRLEAKFEVARTLTEGSDGGCLALLYTLSRREGGDVALVILDRFQETLGLVHYMEVGESIDISGAEPGSYEFFEGDFVSGVATVVRPGWMLGEQILRPPLVKSSAFD